MALYIKGMGNISPQKTFGDDALTGPFVDYQTNRLRAIEPDYASFIDAKQIRRMSRVIKMAVASSSMALKQANISLPDSIITATGYGCLDDTGIFLNKMIENMEVALNPTPFIQSTHNTMGSQIALLLQCQGYNQTYAHGAFSFESALLDALMQSDENSSKNVLIGAIDEITDVSHQIQGRFGIFRDRVSSSLKLLTGPKEDGTINGECSIFFVASGQRSGDDVACITDVQSWYRAEEGALAKSIQSIAHNKKPDLILSGASGDRALDRKLNDVLRQALPHVPVGHFKHLCGEFPVASAFACWLGSHILKTQRVPSEILGYSGKIRNILVVNQYFGTHYSAISLTSR